MTDEQTTVNAIETFCISANNSPVKTFATTLMHAHQHGIDFADMPRAIYCAGVWRWILGDSVALTLNGDWWGICRESQCDHAATPAVETAPGGAITPIKAARLAAHAEEDQAEQARLALLASCVVSDAEATDAEAAPEPATDAEAAPEPAAPS